MISIKCPSCNEKLIIGLNGNPLQSLKSVNCCDCNSLINLRAVGNKLFIFKPKEIKPPTPIIKFTIKKPRYELPMTQYRKSIFAN